MSMAVFETGKEQQLLEYLQSQGMAVVIWNSTSPLNLEAFGLQTAINPGTRSEKSVLEKTIVKRGKSLKEQIAMDLVTMGFRRGQVGFNNIVIAVYEISGIERGKQIRVTSEIYPKVAEYFGSSVYSVERTIRNAIESVWKRSNLGALQELYPYPCDNLNGRPTNAEFLINMGARYRE